MTDERRELEPCFSIGDLVEKFTGDYQLEGEVRGVLTTTAGKTRYVVEHAGGMLHIYGPSNLRPAKSSTPPPGYVLVPEEVSGAMEDAYFEAHAASKHVIADAKEVWSAMLATASAGEKTSLQKMQTSPDGQGEPTA
ncbi:hypothetical protein FHS78_000672 [Parvibaculum indicum]|uniref:hypothetical protein n=1 Tax=Parvibaculum indicum TaxID=562969 RepID=UPI00141FB7C9|nr:hypothetical protein [Parvibaculum indicum]NIJ40402.1 hypothetical protein [Parvibaculum indicum]